MSLDQQPLARPLLRPGARVVRRDDTHLQVGLGPGQVILDDSPEVREVLTVMAEGRRALPETALAHRVRDRLDQAGLLADGDSYWGAVLHHPGDTMTATAYAEDPRSAADRLAARRHAVVGVDVPPERRDLVIDLLAGSGLHTAGADPNPDVWLIARSQPPLSADFDHLAQRGEPHLVVSALDRTVTVGPFVEPGRTACLRCVDAHLALRDPRRALVLEQYASPVIPRLITEPCDSSLWTIALAWAVRDLVTWVEGRIPATWSSTVQLSATLDLPRRRWTRHPHCGCSWDLLPAS
jgi:hypothetical protein